MTLQDSVGDELSVMYAALKDADPWGMRPMILVAAKELDTAIPQEVAYKMANTIRSLKLQHPDETLPVVVAKVYEELKVLGIASDFNPTEVEHWLSNSIWNKTYL